MNSFLEFRNQVINMFKQKNIDVLEVNILFCEALNCSKVDLLSKSKITNKEKFIINRAVKKRLKGMPIQKIFKRAYFYGNEFFINKHVLCPRPETEILVEEVLKLATPNCKILDLCTGTGAIAITVQKNTNAVVCASDISSKALKIAHKNNKKLKSSVRFIKSDLFKNINEKFDIIVSNPPYIATVECFNLDVEVKNYDPIISLDGGADGLNFYREIAQNSPKFLNNKGKVLVEVGYNQAQVVKKLFEQNGFTCSVKKDYNNIERIVIGEKL